MCGLFVSVGFAPDPSFIDIVSYRGPDGRGWKVFDSVCGPVAMGHRRLSIIDLDERAGQPMVSGDDCYWLVFNGESTTTSSYARTWPRRGSGFAPPLTARSCWRPMAFGARRCWSACGACSHSSFTIGAAVVLYLPARFGFRLRDQAADEIPEFSRQRNVVRTRDYLTVGYTDQTGETMFADARQLRGGQCVAVELDILPAVLPIRRYYDLRDELLPRMGEAEAARRFLELFEDSVRLHLRSDVRVGSCPTGGLDSSSIVATMDRLLKGAGAGESIHTVGACYEDATVDERSFMEAVVETTRSVPYYIYPSADRVLEIAERIIWHQDEPQYNTSMYAQWCVFEEAKWQSIKVVLDGQGADEQLAGYHHDAFPTHAGALRRRGHLLGLGRLLLERKLWHGVSVLHQLLLIPDRPRAPRWLWPPQRTPVPGEGWLDTPMLKAARGEQEAYEACLERNSVGKIDNIGRLCRVSLMSTSLPMVLRYEDRSSMAHSIEARLPFLDHKLVELSVGLWDQHKIVGGDTKRVLRVAMAGQLRDAVRYRRDRIGFATPQQDWFRGPLRSSLERGLRDTLDIFPGLFDDDEVILYLEAAMDGRRAADQRLWMLVNLGIWGRIFGMHP